MSFILTYFISLFLKTIKVEASIDERKENFKLNLHNLPSLTRIEISNNYIKKIPNGWFGKKLAPLKYLVLTANEIEVLEDKAFQNLTNLEILNLNKNRLKQIQRSMLPSPKSNIKKLYFRWVESALTMTIDIYRLVHFPVIYTINVLRDLQKRFHFFIYTGKITVVLFIVSARP